MIKYKRIISALIVPAMLCGCENSVISPSLPDMNKCYTMNISSNADSEEIFSAVLTRSGVNEWSLAISEPYALSGVTLKTFDGKITASFEGFSAEVPLEAGIYSSFLEITNVFELLTSPEDLSVSFGENEISASGANFTVIFEQKKPAKLLLNGSGEEIFISDFNITSELPGESEVIMIH